jgi:hypothetical protein
MRQTLPILHARRERRLARQRQSGARTRGAAFSLGVIFSLALAALILAAALAYADLTRDLPSIEALPRLLNPPDGLLLQPTRLYDRSGEHLLLTFASSQSPRGYVPLDPQNPNHIPPVIANGRSGIRRAFRLRAAGLAGPGRASHPGPAPGLRVAVVQ